MMLVYDERITNSVLTEVAEPKLSVDHSVGAVAQAGIEAQIWESFVLRLDAKYIAYRDSHATINNIQVRTQLPSLPTVDVGSAAMDVSVRLFVFQCGIGADF
jgi:outer membrane protein W